MTIDQQAAGAPTNIGYVIVTPVRNERKYIAATIESVAGQTITPLEWIIVDDGSTDGTLDVLQHYAARFPWIKPRVRVDRGFRQAGPGVVDAFYEGYNNLTAEGWKYLVKLDGDVTFPANYFEQIFRRFDGESRLGIAGGALYHLLKNRLVLDKCPEFHVRGATKVYRKECWEDIGGLCRAPGWDTMDEVKANMLGWKTRSYPELQVIHHRFTGTAENLWRNLLKDGRGDYYSGYHPLYVISKCTYRLVTKPYIIGGLGMAIGFFGEYIKRSPRVDDKPMIAFVRQQQLRRLFGLQTIWK